MDTRSWLQRAGITLDVGVIREAQQGLWGVLEEAKKASLPATPSALNALYLYKVPRLSPDGSCSLHGELDPKPYDLGTALGGRSVQNSFALMTLDALVEWAHAATKADWLGVYQVRGDKLVKLAWRGADSRAEFPLTEAFAQKSTNVAVALTGRARELQDVRAEKARGGAYYECDPKVQSEVCLPLFDAAGKLVGVLDAEARASFFFDSTTLPALVALALEAPSHFPPR